MSSNPNHETDSAKPAKQDETSYSHDSIGARVGEGLWYVHFLHKPRTACSIVIKTSGAMKLVHGRYYEPPWQLLLLLYDSHDDRCAR